MNGKPYLEFREDGTFHVLHITDLQEGVHPKKDTLRLLHALLRDNGQVMAVFCGHDHKNDFVGRVDGIDLGDTPSGGFACYGPGAERGGRLLTFHVDRPMHYETKLLRCWYGNCCYHDLSDNHGGCQ